MQFEMRELADKVIARCRYLAQFTDEPGQIKRTFLSPAMRECMQVVQGWMEAAGMQVVTDAAGNLRGRYPGSSSTSLMIGSHLDTVPNSGAFDGVLGVMMGLALIEALWSGEAALCHRTGRHSQKKREYVTAFPSSAAGRWLGDWMVTCWRSAMATESPLPRR